MDVYVNKNEKTVEWNVGEKIVTIYNEHVLYNNIIQLFHKN